MQGHTQTTTELVSKFKYLFRNFTSVIKIKSWFQNHSFLFERVEVYLKTEFSALLLKQNISNWSWKGRKIFCFVSCFILFIKITQTHILTFSFYYFLTLLLSLPYHSYYFSYFVSILLLRLKCEFYQIPTIIYLQAVLCFTTPNILSAE